jgi:hypothetical protein
MITFRDGSNCGGAELRDVDDDDTRRIDAGRIERTADGDFGNRLEWECRQIAEEVRVELGLSRGVVERGGNLQFAGHRIARRQIVRRRRDRRKRARVELDDERRLERRILRHVGSAPDEGQNRRQKSLQFARPFFAQSA